MLIFLTISTGWRTIRYILPFRNMFSQLFQTQDHATTMLLSDLVCKQPRKGEQPGSSCCILMSLPRFSPFHVLFLNLTLIFSASINLYCFVLFLFLTMLFIKFTSFKYTAWWILVIVYNHSHHDNQNTERFLPCFYYTCSPPSVIPLASSNHWL